MQANTKISDGGGGRVVDPLSIAVKDFAPVATAATPTDSRVGSWWRCPRALRWSGIAASRSGSGDWDRATAGSTGHGVVRDDDTGGYVLPCDGERRKLPSSRVSTYPSCIYPGVSSVFILVTGSRDDFDGALASYP